MFREFLKKALDFFYSLLCLLKNLTVKRTGKGKCMNVSRGIFFGFIVGATLLKAMQHDDAFDGEFVSMLINKMKGPVQRKVEKNIGDKVKVYSYFLIVRKPGFVGEFYFSKAQERDGSFSWYGKALYIINDKIPKNFIFDTKKRVKPYFKALRKKYRTEKKSYKSSLAKNL